VASVGVERHRLGDNRDDEREPEHRALVCRPSDAPIVVGEQREQLGGRAAGERRADPLDEPRIADALEGGREPLLEEILALREGGGIERVLGHVTRECNIGPKCHRMTRWLLVALGDRAAPLPSPPPPQQSLAMRPRLWSLMVFALAAVPVHAQTAG